METTSKPRVSPKDFFLWAGAMLAFYVSVFAFISLLFEYINYTFPDALTYMPPAYSGSMRFDISALIVLFPVFLVLMRLIRSGIARNPEKRDLWVRRWALMLTLFVAGVTVVIDLIVLITNYLGGDLTWPFLLKVLVVLLVVGAGFLHFLADMWGYWDENRSKANMVGWGAVALIVVVIATGFVIMGSPANVRLYRFDEQKVSDLQNIQWQTVNYWQQREKLPVSLSALADPISGYMPPIDPQSNQAYEYEVVGAKSFKLCATFNAETQTSASSATYARPVAVGESGTLLNDNWYHTEGRNCFVRVIDPARYPPLPTKGR